MTNESSETQFDIFAVVSFHRTNYAPMHFVVRNIDHSGTAGT